MRVWLDGLVLIENIYIAGIVAIACGATGRAYPACMRPDTCGHPLERCRVCVYYAIMEPSTAEPLGKKQLWRVCATCAILRCAYWLLAIVASLDLGLDRIDQAH